MQWYAPTTGKRGHYSTFSDTAIVTVLRNRGVQDIFIACVDGLKAFINAIEAVYPNAVVQLCVE